MRTNYTAITTCACIGENLAWSLPEVNGVVEHPTFSTAEVDQRVGSDSSWEQRRAFEWGLLGGLFRRSGDTARADYCVTRVTELATAASTKSR